MQFTRKMDCSFGNGRFTLRYCRKESELSASDRCAMMDLEAKSPQGFIGLRFYLTPSSVGKSSDCQFITVMAVDNESGAIAGMGTSNVRSVRMGTSYEKVALMTAARIDPAYRRNGLGKKLADELLRIIVEEYGAVFTYGQSLIDNEPIIRMVIKKYGGDELFREQWATFNVSHCVRHSLPSGFKCIPGDVIVRKMSLEESRNYLIQHCGDFLLFPQDPASLTSNVVIATAGQHSVAINLASTSSVHTFVGAPITTRLKIAHWNIMSWLFPTWYQRPFDFHRPLHLIVGMPFIVELGEDATTEKTLEILKVLISYLITDITTWTDQFCREDAVLALPTCQVASINGKSSETNKKAHAEVINKFLASWSCIPWRECFPGKTLLPDNEKAAQLMKAAQSSKAWFLDPQYF